MKKINRIIILQIGFVVGGIVSFYIMDAKVNNVIVNHIILTAGCLCGVLAFKK
jgi:hypothetical protein